MWGEEEEAFLEEDKGQDNIIRARGLEMSYLNGREERNYMLTFGDDVVFEEELKRRLGSGRSSSFAQVARETVYPDILEWGETKDTYSTAGMDPEN